MEGRRCCWGASSLLAAFLLLQLGLINAQRSKPSQWKTLSGDSPVVIAKGGFSGLFPDSSEYAYNFVKSYSLDAILWCDVRLTKDGVGICLPKLNLENCTNINSIYPSRKSTYNVNGVRTAGWFSVDYNKKELDSQVYLTQGVYSRTPDFDGFLSILTVEDVVTIISPPAPALWLNIQNDIFYTQHKLSMRSYLLNIAKRVILNYVSSPEVGFLHSIAPRFAKTKTKLIFRFLDEDIIEPSTNQTYGSLLKNLTFIKTFASGILVPKEYIWPTSSDNYLLPYMSIVKDAHKEKLEIYAADFANDVTFSYNYSYDPVAEYLNFIDNGAFSVDGVLSDFPITPSEAIGCFSHTNKNTTRNGKPKIISHNGASGMYPGCTDLAYQQAVRDGVDFIDCPVQVTKDGYLICMGSINLVDDTTVTKSQFSSLSSTIPELQSTSGTFTFNLTWENIQDLRPLISSPEFTYGNLIRNPRQMTSGHFMKLSDFLTFAKGQDLSGILISIEKAAFMAEKLGFSVTDSVISALNDAGYSNQMDLEVMIQSTDSSVLVKFKQLTKYKLLYKIPEPIGDAVASSITDIKRFSDTVVIPKTDIFPTSLGFITRQTDLVQEFRKANLSVIVYGFRNEFVSQPWDFFSDAVVEINAHVEGAKVDGVISDFSGTVANYRRNSCSKLGKNTPNYMLPVAAGGLVSLLNSTGAEPPALAPMASLKPSDVVESPLPPASAKPSTPPTHIPTPPSSQPSSGPPLIHPTSIFFLISLLI